MDSDEPDRSPRTATSLGESALAQSSERYASMFHHHPHATYSVDEHGYFTDANDRTLEMTGLSLEEMRQAHFAEVIHPDDLPVIQAGFERAMKGEPQVEEARVLDADGEVTVIRCTMIPVVVGGEVVGVHGVSEDVTEAKRLVRELEEANLAKTLFLATVSHEVRTPLAALIGATDLLMESDLDPEPAHFVRHGPPLQPAPGPPGRRPARVLRPRGAPDGAAPPPVRRTRPRGRCRAVGGTPGRGSRPAHSPCTSTTVPASAVGDARRMTQVVTNLVQNAITFTEQGTVDLGVRARPPAPDPGDAHATETWVEFIVTDTGIGITDEHVDSLFEPFVQADRYTDRARRGIGLGLPICRALADLMDGRMQVSLDAGRGQHVRVRPAHRQGGRRRARGGRQPTAESAVTAASASTRAAMPVAASSMRRLPWCRSYVGPPGVRVPSRAIAPGTESRNHPKSSPPRLCVVETWPCGPRTRSRAVAEQPRCDTSWLTTGGTPRW